MSQAHIDSNLRASLVALVKRYRELAGGGYKVNPTDDDPTYDDGRETAARSTYEEAADEIDKLLKEHTP